MLRSCGCHKEERKIVCSNEERPADNASLQGMEKDTQAGILQEEVEIHTDHVKFRVEAEFENMKDEARFYYDAGEGWKQIGISQKLYFKMDHFYRLSVWIVHIRYKGNLEAVRDFLNLYTDNTCRMENKRYTGMNF